ncbi:MAG: CAP domain-containing protein [Bacteroidota bacterium]
MKKSNSAFNFRSITSFSIVQKHKIFFIFLWFIFISLLILSPSSYSQTPNNTIEVISDSDSLYVNYNTKEFLKLEKLNNPINFKNPDIELLNAAIFHLTNKERKKRKNPKLSFSAELSKAARFHSEQMREKKFCSHYNKKDKKFYSPGDRIRYFGGRFNLSGENVLMERPLICIGYSRPKIFFLSRYSLKESEYKPMTYLELAENMVKSWMSSRGHRKNILHPDFRFLGCGVALPEVLYKSMKKNYAYATQNFGG